MASKVRTSTPGYSGEGLESVSQAVVRNGPDLLRRASTLGAVGEDDRNNNNMSCIAVAEKSLALAQTAAQVAWDIRENMDAYDDQNMDFKKIQLDLSRAFSAVLDAMLSETHSGTGIYGIASELLTEIEDPVDVSGPYIPDSYFDISLAQILAPPHPAVLGDISKSEARPHHVCEDFAGVSANTIYDTLTERVADALLEPLVARVTDKLLAELPGRLVDPLEDRLIPALGNRLQEAVRAWRSDVVGTRRADPAASGSGVTKASSSGPLDPIMTAPSGFKMSTSQSLNGKRYLRASQEHKRRRTDST